MWRIREDVTRNTCGYPGGVGGITVLEEHWMLGQREETGQRRGTEQKYTTEGQQGVCCATYRVYLLYGMGEV